MLLKKSYLVSFARTNNHDCINEYVLTICHRLFKIITGEGEQPGEGREETL